jgi:hypothetical protein
MTGHNGGVEAPSDVDALLDLLEGCPRYAPLPVESAADQ